MKFSRMSARVIRSISCGLISNDRLREDVRDPAEKYLNGNYSSIHPSIHSFIHSCWKDLLSTSHVLDYTACAQQTVMNTLYHLDTVELPWLVTGRDFSKV